MSREAESSVSILGVVLIVFIVLKLTDNITWSWVWVLAPVWVIPSFLVILLIVMSPFAITRAVIRKRRQNTLMQEQLDAMRRRS